MPHVASSRSVNGPSSFRAHSTLINRGSACILRALRATSSRSQLSLQTNRLTLANNSTALELYCGCGRTTSGPGRFRATTSKSLSRTRVPRSLANSASGPLSFRAHCTLIHRGSACCWSAPWATSSRSQPSLQTYRLTLANSSTALEQ